MPSLDHLPLPLSRRRLLGLAIGSGLAYRLGAIDPVAAQSDAPFTFLVLGLDTREENADQRSDIIMVSRVDLSANSIRTLSIPRDLYVEIPGYGWDKINAAYQQGLASSTDLDWEEAAQLTADTIAHNLGVTIDDGFAMTSMTRFPAIIDEVGGIEVDNPYELVDPDWPEVNFPAGIIHLDGQQALVFTRSRSIDADGGRVMRQHLVLEGLLQRIQDPDVFDRLPQIVTSLAGAVKTNIGLDVQVQLMAMVPGLSTSSLEFTNIDSLLTPGYTDDGAWIYQADWETLPGYVTAWLDGEID
jgi:LCP family protein required for cell wall assembly